MCGIYICYVIKYHNTVLDIEIYSGKIHNEGKGLKVGCISLTFNRVIVFILYNVLLYSSHCR